MQIIQSRPSSATLRQAALDDSMKQIIGGLGAYDQQQKTKRAEALALNEQAVKLREQGYDVTPEMVAQSVQEKPSSFAKFFGAKDPEKVDLYANRTKEWDEKQRIAKEDRTFKRQGDMLDQQVKTAQADKFKAEADDLGKPYWDSKKGRAEKEKSVDEIRKEVSGLPHTKSLIEIDTSLAKIRSAPKTAAGDITRVFSFMKMNDPNSTVREGEYATAQNAAGVPERVRAAYNKSLTGEVLTDLQRADFEKSAMALGKSQYQTFMSATEPQRKRASQLGLDESMIFPTFSQASNFTSTNQNTANKQAIGNNASAEEIAVIKSPERTQARQTRIQQLRAKGAASGQGDF